jgi:uncharacterized membrane protein YeaQ/YmgE (transglycosylase-associated protein family)
MVFADVVLHPGSVAAWILFGLLVGWLAGKLMEDASYGPIGDFLLGAAGALAGGALFGCFVDGEPFFWSTALAALVGACVILAVGRAIAAARNA